MKYYVYYYKCPITGEIFYVGKGSGDRYRKHLSETYETTENKKKYAKIQSIRNKGHEPVVSIVRYFTSEEDAYNFEAAEIKRIGRLGLDKNGTLTNICIDHRPPKFCGENNGFYGKTHSDESKALMQEKRALQKPPMQGKQHSKKTKDMLRESNKSQFEDPWQIEIRRQKCGQNAGRKRYYCKQTGKRKYFHEEPDLELYTLTKPNL